MALSARIFPDLAGTPGLWPVVFSRDGRPVAVRDLATPLAQAALDASRAGTLVGPDDLAPPRTRLALAQEAARRVG